MTKLPHRRINHRSTPRIRALRSAYVRCARTLLLGTFLISVTQQLIAQSVNVRLDTGWNALSAALGPAMPTGVGVPVTQVEAADNSGWYAPSTGPTADYFEFTGKTFALKSGTQTTASSHAIFVGRSFYGTGYSLAPGITAIDAYSVSNSPTWYGSGVDGILNMGTNNSPLYLASASRVTNHSWVGSFGPSASDLEFLLRTDWLVHTDDHLQVVGVNNINNGGPQRLLSSGMNTISVGLVSGIHESGNNPVPGNTIYNNSHPRPDLVAPLYATSFATPLVSAAAASLIQAAQNNPAWSSVTYVGTRSGATIRAAETAEVIRAALMAGATRSANQADGIKLNDWRAAGFQSNNGLDTRYGAGLLNIRHAYDILAATQQTSLQDGRLTDVGVTGFDYDMSFGGASGSNNVGTYEFVGSWTGQQFQASLVWNVEVDINKTKTATLDLSNAAILRNLNLRLFDITGGGNTQIASSVSLTENTEHITTTLTGGNRYRLEVTRLGAAFNWDYGLAWNGTSNLLWTGANGNVWNDGGAANWQRGAGSSVFRANDQVVFNDTSAVTTVQITSLVQPDNVLFANNSQAITLTGGGLSGSLQLRKTGTGLVTLAQVNTYIGDTQVLNGTLRAGVANALPSGATLTIDTPGTVDLNGFAATLGHINGIGTLFLNGGVLTWNPPAASTFSGTFNGGNVTKAGTQTLTLDGNLLWQNNTTALVDAGTLILNQSPSRTVTVGTGGQIGINMGSILQLAGSKSSLSDNTNALRVLSFGSTSQLVVTGTNQSTGRIAGPSAPSAVNGLAVGTTLLQTGASLTAAGLRQNSLTMQAGTTLNITANGLAGNYVVLNNTANGGAALTLNPTSTINLNNNDLILYYNPQMGANDSLRFQIEQYVKNGINNTAGPKFTSLVGESAELVLLGVGDNYYTTHGDQFLGQQYGDLSLGNGAFGEEDPVGRGFNQILVRYTYAGDANLDGVVNSVDYDYFLAGLGSSAPTTGWQFGDWNYDGATNSLDYDLFLGNLGTPAFSAGSGPTPLYSGSFAPDVDGGLSSFGDNFMLNAGASGAGIQAIPEPSLAAAAMLSLPAWLLLRRRRASRRQPL